MPSVFEQLPPDARRMVRDMEMLDAALPPREELSHADQTRQWQHARNDVLELRRQVATLLHENRALREDNAALARELAYIHDQTNDWS